MITNNKIPRTQLESEVSQTITNGVTDKAPSEDAVFDALALKKDTVSVYFVIAGLSPADSTTYYSTRLSPTTTASSHAIKFPYNGTIKGATIVASGNTIQGSNEDNTFNFRNVTQGTSSLLSNSVKSNATATSVVNTTVSGLNIPFLSTNEVCLEWITPSYSTNPTGVSWYIYLDIEKTS